jgi:hypothetical protein
MRDAIAIVFLAAFATAGTAAEKERHIPFRDVPPELKAAADKAVPGAKWDKVQQETEKGRTYYEFKGKGSQGDREVEVELLSDGTLLQTEVEVPLDQVPAVVRDTLRQRWPNYKPKEVKAVTRADGSQGYEFEESRMVGREFEVFVSGDGKIVEQKED